MEQLPLNCEISSDLATLDKYHAAFGWVPSSRSIRCDPPTQEKKNEEISIMRGKWDTAEDFISFRIFGDDFNVHSNGKFKAVVEGSMLRSLTQPLDWQKDIVFRKNDFPYGGLTCHHWVLWYRIAYCPTNRSTITNDLIRKFMDLTGVNDLRALLQKVSFIWYENPKRNTLSQHFHVQVFWIEHM
jgi:hypothetical protein